MAFIHSVGEEEGYHSTASLIFNGDELNNKRNTESERVRRTQPNSERIKLFYSFEHTG